jgi:hypothetical protein
MIENSMMKPTKTKKQEEEGEWLRKFLFYQNTLYTCYKYHNETPLYS